MELFDIARAVRAEYVEKLKDQTTGLGTSFDAYCARYGIKARPFLFDGKQSCLWQANVTPEQLDESTPSRYPYVMMYAPVELNSHIAAYAEFSGTVAINVDVHLSWLFTAISRDMESYADAVSAAVTRAVYADDVEWLEARPGKETRITRGPVKFAGENCLQSIRFQTVFTINI